MGCQRALMLCHKIVNMRAGGAVLLVPDSGRAANTFAWLIDDGSSSCEKRRNFAHSCNSSAHCICSSTVNVVTRETTLGEPVGWSGKHGCKFDARGRRSCSTARRTVFLPNTEYWVGVFPHAWVSRTSSGPGST